MLEEAGPQATAAAQEARKRDDMKAYLRTRLGLQVFGVSRVLLTTEPDAGRKLAQAFERLAQAADRIRELNVREQTLIVGAKYAIGDDGTLFIPWNFELESLTPKQLPPNQQQGGDKK